MKKAGLVVMALLLASPELMAQGKVLHDAACLQCHASLTNGKPNSLYMRADHKIKTLAGLKKRVKACAVAADANWSTADHDAVVNYLTKTFYRF